MLAWICEMNIWNTQNNQAIEEIDIRALKVKPETFVTSTKC